ncbi:MAG TPA: hypothetical protein EYP09_06845 [Anaerolineae bacterium]|nr:hypothetical protein [Anaerolineae bacterium]
MGLTAVEFVIMALGAAAGACAFLLPLPLWGRVGLALGGVCAAFVLAFARVQGLRSWQWLGARLRYSQRPRARTWGKSTTARSGRALAALALMTLIALLLAGNLWRMCRGPVTGEAAATPTPTAYLLFMPVVQRGPTTTPPAPTPMPTPTPAWQTCFFDDFDDGALAGWNVSLEAHSRGHVAESGGMVSLTCDDIDEEYARYFPILYRSDIFPQEASEFEFEINFRYDHLAEHGVDIGISSQPERGHYWWEETQLIQAEPWNLDILDIHHVFTPDDYPSQRRRFRVKLLRGENQVLWEGRPGDTGWHLVKVTARRESDSWTYALWVDGNFVGQTSGHLRPVSFQAGHKLGKWGGRWTWVHIDYIRVRCR